MANTIELVTHAFSGHLRQYEVFLALHCESLIRYPLPERHQVRLTVVTHVRDYRVLGTLGLFSKRLNEAGVMLTVLAQESDCLHRRCIGRNKAALATKADVVWFLDVDYWFGKGCLENVLNYWEAKGAVLDPMTTLYCPGRYMCMNEHEEGDQLIHKVAHMMDNPVDPESPLDGFEINPAQFFERRNKTAIGGLQIVTGDFCRAKGYLPDDPEHSVPRHGEDLEIGVQRTKDDVQFRRTNNLKTERFKLLELYRFRHSEAGRDKTADETK